MSESDKAFAHSHAERYAEGSPSFGARANEYADWYIETYWTDEEGIDGLPSHERTWTKWLKETEQVS